MLLQLTMAARVKNPHTWLGVSEPQKPPIADFDSYYLTAKRVTRDRKGISHANDIPSPPYSRHGITFDPAQQILLQGLPLITAFSTCANCLLTIGRCGTLVNLLDRLSAWLVGALMPDFRSKSGSSNVEQVATGHGNIYA